MQNKNNIEVGKVSMFTQEKFENLHVEKAFDVP
jgi:hypothetical protein